MSTSIGVIITFWAYSIMSKIYTRTGDKGTTGIHGGERVDKDHSRIHAVGEIDELNCFIGKLRSGLSCEDERQALLHRIQRDLMVVMSHVATPHAIRSNNPNPLPDDLVSFCESYIDERLGRLQDNGYFLLPGGSPVAADCHICRAVARRSERWLWTLHRSDPLPEELLQFVNRLSDLFFVMAREELSRLDLPEERWQAFAYKRKKQQ